MCKICVSLCVSVANSSKGRKMRFKPIITSLLIYLLTISFVGASELKPLQPSKKDKCPVCGMFVSKYPDWVGEIIFKDDATAFFDGAKDLFKYYFNLKKYNPSKTHADIASIYVTDYYDMKLIEAQTAYFVIGSDVYGPMGRELIPFINNADAETFKKDHKGRLILKFDQVTPAIIRKNGKYHTTVNVKNVNIFHKYSTIKFKAVELIKSYTVRVF